MKDQRHKRKESYSILLVSNMGGSSKQFNISVFFLRAICIVMLLICIAAGWFGYQYMTGDKKTETLKEQLFATEQTVTQLEAEKEALNGEKQALTTEIETLRQTIAEKEAEAAAKAEEEAAAAAAAAEAAKDPTEDPAFPSRYPSHGASVLKENYSEEQPYLAITTYSGGDIVAAGDGTVVSTSSDDTYANIVEVEHATGYRTRYLCRQQAELKVEEGAQVSIGDTLLTIITDETQLDYQVIYEGAPVDPLTVIDAKG